jgi:GDP-4-dehydro-6-deoxy-D-mannose reductase
MEVKRAAPVLTTGNLSVVRDFLPVNDAVRAYYLLTLRGKTGECYNVSSGRGISVRQGLEILARQSRIPFKVEVLHSRFRRNDFPRMVAKPLKLQRLGWRAKESLRRTLGELLEEWRGKVADGLV